jgi:DNA gyrase/topoisomerase IV subunit A
MIEQLDTDKALIKYYMPYAMKTITDRALPDVRDGLKPIARRILWKLHSIGCTYDKPRMKCGTIVGDILKIHNHGDVSVYNALSLLTEQNESLLTPYIDGEGAFGKVYSKDSPAAMRYTFARLNKFSEIMFKDIDKNTVKFIGEDKEHLQPLVLTNIFPNILLKPNAGLAVGEACNWASFNLNEVINTTISYIKNKDIDLLDYLLAPDFSTGGYILYNKSNLQEIYNTGKGNFKLRAKYVYDKTNNYIEIYEIPFNTDVDSIKNEIKNLIKNGKIKEILDVRDETGFNKKIKKEQLKITIDTRKNIDINKVMHFLYKNTPLEKTFSCNFNALVNYKPQVLGIKHILDIWIAFRQECIKNATQYDINKKSSQLHSLKGLEKVLLNIDKAIDIIRNSENDEKIINNLMVEFNIDNSQAEDIANMKLRNINKSFILNRIKKINDIENDINKLKQILNNPTEINNIIIHQLQEVSDKYGQPRRTEIVYEDNLREVNTEDFIEDSNVHITLTTDNYFKKTLATSLRGNTTQKLKDNDSILIELDSTNKSNILFFTNKGNCYKKHLYEFDDCRLSSLGLYLKNELQLENDEIIIHTIITKDYKENLVIAFANGKVAKIDLQSYFTKQNRTKLMNAINTNSTIINMFTITKDIDITCQSSIDKVLVINTSFINVKSSKSTQGVQIMKSKNDSIMTTCMPLDSVNIDEIDDVEYYKVSSAGVGKFKKKTDNIKLI